jgi:hypothetical protein
MDLLSPLRPKKDKNMNKRWSESDYILQKNIFTELALNIHHLDKKETNKNFKINLNEPQLINTKTSYKQINSEPNIDSSPENTHYYNDLLKQFKKQNKKIPITGNIKKSSKKKVSFALANEEIMKRKIANNNILMDMTPKNRDKDAISIIEYSSNPIPLITTVGHNSNKENPIRIFSPLILPKNNNIHIKEKLPSEEFTLNKMNSCSSIQNSNEDLLQKQEEIKNHIKKCLEVPNIPLPSPAKKKKNIFCCLPFIC